MSTNMPTGVDSYTTKVDLVTTIAAAHVNNLQAAMVQTEDIVVGPVWFNVQSAAYGAKGDGVTDDTAAIQAAITAANNTLSGTVYFPPPSVSYLVTGTGFTISKGIRFLGASGQNMLGAARGSVINYTGSGSLFTLSGGVNRPLVIFDNLYLLGGANSINFIKATDSANPFDIYITDCIMQNLQAATSIAIDIENQYFALIRGSAIVFNVNGIFMSSMQDDPYINGNFIGQNTGYQMKFFTTEPSVVGNFIDEGLSNPNSNPMVIFDHCNGTQFISNAVQSRVAPPVAPLVKITNSLDHNSPRGFCLIGNQLVHRKNNTGNIPCLNIDVSCKDGMFSGNTFNAQDAAPGATPTGTVSFTNVASSGDVDSLTFIGNRSEIGGNATRISLFQSVPANVTNLVVFDQGTMALGGNIVSGIHQILGAAGAETVEFGNTTDALRWMRAFSSGTAAASFTTTSDAVLNLASSGTFPYSIHTRGGIKIDGISGAPALSVVAGDAAFGGHLISNASGTPSTTNLGTNVTSATFTGNDTRGTIAVVMGGALAANTRIATCTFATSYGATAPKVTLVNQTSGAGLTIVNFYVLAQSTGVSFDLAADQALATGTYTVDYIVIG